MTNYEKYKDDIIDLVSSKLAVNKNTGQPTSCEYRYISCEDCLFLRNDCENKGPRDWLNAEYVPPQNSTIEVATLISYLRQEPNQMKRVKTISIVDGMPVINGGE